jgi:predicted ATPase
VPPGRDDRRVFGPGPFITGLAGAAPSGDGFPFDVPAVRDVERLRLDAPVTLLAGDNGTGKSTLVEAIAEAMGFAPEGGELSRLGALPAVPRPVLGETFTPVLTHHRPANGYFLRAESFFNVAALVDEGGGFAPDISLYGGVKLHEQSHGQSFLALGENRFAGNGLYILDEPEAALSATGCLALIAVIVAAARAGAQFVIATHSPFLLAIPGARIYELDDRGVSECAYDDLDAIRFTRGFLDAPERYLRAALGDA